MVGAVWRAVSCDRLGQVGSTGETKARKQSEPKGIDAHSAGSKQASDSGGNGHTNNDSHTSDDDAVVVLEATMSRGGDMYVGSSHSGTSSSWSEWLHSMGGWHR